MFAVRLKHISKIEQFRGYKCKCNILTTVRQMWLFFIGGDLRCSHTWLFFIGGDLRLFDLRF